MPRTSSKVARLRRVLLISACLSLAALATTQTLPHSGRVLASGDRHSRAKDAAGIKAEDTRARLLKSYGKLPLRFEANQGQTSREVKFLSRGSGYTLFLTSSEAVMRLRKEGGASEDAGPRAVSRRESDAATLRVRLVGANESPAITGVDELPGRSNYLVGGDSRAWSTNVANFARVMYASVYPGVDLVYYGDQGRLEYDFHLAPGSDPRRIRLRFDGAKSARLDEQGDLVLATGGGDIRQHKPFAYQEAGGVRTEVAARYLKAKDGTIRFEVGEYDLKRPLVIDPVIVYSTYLGGSDFEEGHGVAVDASGSAYITGSTSSVNFPVAGAAQAAAGGFDDAFVVKLDPSGTSLVYATYIGGEDEDIGNAITVGGDGSAYVVGQTYSAGFPHTSGVWQGAKAGGFDAFVAKLSSSGSSLAYSTFLGGNDADYAYGVATDAAGNAYVVGTADSVAFTGVPNETRGGNPLLKSTDGATNWAASGTGLTASAVNDLAFASSDAGIVYAGSNNGVFKSADGGASWQLTGAASAPVTPIYARAVAVDPSNASVLYVGASPGVYKSVDGGAHYESKNSGLFNPIVNTLAIDPSTPTTLYAGTSSGIYKSTNGGDSWMPSRAGINANRTIYKIIIDPTNSQVVYAGTNGGLYKTTNGGSLWAAANTGLMTGNFVQQIYSLAVDTTNTSTLYAGTYPSDSGVFKSVDGGAHWTQSSNGLSVVIAGQSFVPGINELVVDPSMPASIYAGTSGGGLFKSADGGATWSAGANGFNGRVVTALAARPGSPAALLAGLNVGGDAFVAKLGASGATLDYLKFLGGFENDEGHGVAVDASGSAYVTGLTDSMNFPTANAFQSASAGPTDAFLTKLNPSGTVLDYSTYLGGSGYDVGAGLALGPGGTIYVTGTTTSANFPTKNPLKPGVGTQADAFVTKFAADGGSLVYSTYLGGADSYEEGSSIAVGADGSAYVAGTTQADGFPIVNFSEPRGGGSFDADAFIAKLNPAGSALTFATFFGGTGDDYGNAVAVDPAGGIYLVGNTASSDFPVVNPFRATPVGGEAFVTKFGPGVDLAVTLSDSPDPVAFGADLTYIVNVNNFGDLAANGVALTITTPAGATFISATSNHGACSGSGPVVCNLGTLNGGEQATASIKLKPPAVRTINATASVTLNEPDAVPGNNSASVSTNVDFADLSVTKSALNGTVAPGSKVFYLLTVTNKGGITAGPVTLADNLPQETAFVSCDSPHGVCGGAGNNRSITFSSLAVGATESAVIVGLVNQPLADGTVFNNTATVGSALADPDTSNNSASASVTAKPFAVAPASNGKIVFASFDGIYVVNTDGTGRTKIHDKLADSNEHFPVWSPDGTMIAFQRETTGSSFTFFEMYVMNADGSNVRRVSTNGEFNNRPTWSPDGSHIAFIGRDFAVYAVGADGTGEARILPSLGIANGLDWSADGTRFTFYKDNAHVFVMDADGGNQRQLTFTEHTPDGDTRDTDPLWSHDGSKIVFTRRTDNDKNVFVVNIDGTGLTRLLNMPGIERGQLSPDGTKLVYNAFSGVQVANIDGFDLPVLLGRGSDPNWQLLPNPNPMPQPSPVTTFSISGHVATPDGQSAVKLSGARTATIFTDRNGDYTFVNLPKGGTYTITPANDFARFTPGSRTINDLQRNESGLDFTSTRLLFTIKGRIGDADSHAVAGVRVLLTGAGQLETTTDANGNYSFTVFPSGIGWNVLPISGSLSFDPGSIHLPSVPGDTATANFVGMPVSSVGSITVFASDSAGINLSGVLVTLSGARTVTGKTHDGIVTFANLPQGQTYTVTSSADSGFAFASPQQTVANLGTGASVFFKATTAQPTVRFSPPSYSVGEEQGNVLLTVTRTGDLSAAGSVDYATGDAAGSARSDYTAAYGTLRFAKGEAAKSIRVLVTDDALVEGSRTFTVTLSGGSGVQLGDVQTATVTINEDDATPVAQNPIDDSRAFVRQHYADFLNREPDASGLQFWTGEIESCGANAQCREVKRINVSAAFFLSIEFQETGYFVYRLHQAAFSTGERLNLKTFLKDTQEIGREVVVGQGNWQAQLEANKQAFVGDFVLRPEFLAVYPATMSPAQFVDLLNVNTGGSLTQAERDSLVAALSAGTTTRAAALRTVTENAVFTRREFDKAFVLMQYFGYLRRSPADAPDSDFSGWQFWLSKLNQFNGNFVNAEMVKAFINSIEYRRRFGQ
jgi:uncharacterized repeat protein (TIGR01451 family)